MCGECRCDEDVLRLGCFFDVFVERVTRGIIRLFEQEGKVVQYERTGRG